MSILSGTSIHAQFRLTRQSKGLAPFELDVATELPAQGVTAIFGHSGSGKTTFLRCVAGLERAQSGYLEIEGQVWQDAKQFMPTHKRPLGYVFQESSLFEHLTAFGNLKFAIKRAEEPTSSEDFDRIVSLMGIEPILSRYPKQLSGGERQRVAIARALLIQPRILLMDEPLASLDNARKQEILPYLAKLRTSLDIPILYVSHAVDEIAQLADHVMVLESGKLVAQGALSEVFSRTDLRALSGFDTGAVWQGQVIEREPQWHLAKVACGASNLWVRDVGDEVGTKMRLRILARDVSLSRSEADESSIVNRLPVTILDITPDQDAAMVLIRLASAEQVLIARLTKRSLDTMQLAVGQSLWAQIKSVAIVR
ncbi:molybdenum ABC transporter ATP-binding protein [Marinomonas fungiae]|uniref:Molybdenum ABC transporter, ATP-binding protein n=1 Tax=Marinomonas fungiae TaxID=1137284 RepID=A0A0K6IGS2_9GAMM|nr:molybdenum ABC transporter ATP-binding protein [Marinomonas fungiae]CUB02288.1 molybdenum ABC transporter, ATP-binding protein [Marinomonas fungiae]